MKRCNWVEIKSGVYECQYCGNRDFAIPKSVLRRVKARRKAITKEPSND